MIFDMHFHTTCPTRKQMNGKQMYDSYGTRRLEMCCCENFGQIFHITDLDVGTAAVELSRPTGVSLVW